MASAYDTVRGTVVPQPYTPTRYTKEHIGTLLIPFKNIFIAGEDMYMGDLVYSEDTDAKGITKVKKQVGGTVGKIADAGKTGLVIDPRSEIFGVTRSTADSNPITVIKANTPVFILNKGYCFARLNAGETPTKGNTAYIKSSVTDRTTFTVTASGNTAVNYIKYTGETHSVVDGQGNTVLYAEISINR